MTTRGIFIVVGVALLVVAAVFTLGFRFGSQRAAVRGINSFDECAAAGYPVMESYPAQCRTPDGRNFVQPIQGGAVCTADAYQCPDGTWVGRTGPRCEFVCP
jgi:hypothetical protein